MEVHTNYETYIRLAAVCIIVLLIIFLKMYRERKLPPGPYGLPFLGYLPFLRHKTLHLQLYRIGEKYGPVFSIKLGSVMHVIISDSKIIREYYTKPELNARPPIPFYKFAKYPSPLFGSNVVWSQHRKFLTNCFREIGVGREALQESILEQTEELISKFSKAGGKPICIHKDLDLFVSNIVSQICFGKIIDFKSYNIMKRSYEIGLKIFVKLSILLFFPWVFNISPAKKVILRQLKIIDDITKNVSSIIKENVSEQESNMNNFQQNNYTSMYLREMKNRGSKYEFDEASLFGSIIDIYGAGIPTTLPSLEWCLYNMAFRPDIQRKVQQEIDQIIGRDGLPTYSDQKDMPYTHSVLLEMQRLYTPVWLIIPRRVLKDINIMGYEIPKGTIVMGNIYAMHHDPSIWENPKDFLPERFLDPKNGDAIRKPDSFIPFSYGKRSCPGDVLAQMEIFLCFVRILQKFNIQPAEGKSISLEGVITIVNQPKEQELRFIQREASIDIQ